MAQTFTYRQKPKFPKTLIAFGSSIALLLGVLLPVVFLHLNHEGVSGNVARAVLFVGGSFLIMLVLAMVALVVEWNGARRHFEANQAYSPWARPIDPSLGQGGRVWSPNSWE